MALSQGIRARLEVQRVLLKEKLDQLGPRDPPSALSPDPEASPPLSVTGIAHVSEGRLGGGRGSAGFPDNVLGLFSGNGGGLVLRSEAKFYTVIFCWELKTNSGRRTSQVPVDSLCFARVTDI